MPQSLNKVILHMVFSTKDRMPLIDAGIRPRLHAYMATVFREIDPTQCQAYRVGGVADHVHIAGTLPRTVTVSKLFEIVKKESSIWIKKQGGAYEKFYWQAGTVVFPSLRRNLINLSTTSTIRRITTRQSPFKTNSAPFSANTTSNTTNDMFGIDCPHMKQAFSLRRLDAPIPRALPWAMMQEAFSLRIRSVTTPASSPGPTALPVNPPVFPTRPTASPILAQGNALGDRADELTQPEGLPHNPAIRRPPHMKQAFSLQRFCTPIPRALPWASMREAVGLQTTAM